MCGGAVAFDTIGAVVTGYAVRTRSTADAGGRGGCAARIEESSGIAIVSSSAVLEVIFVSCVWVAL